MLVEVLRLRAEAVENLLRRLDDRHAVVLHHLEVVGLFLGLDFVVVLAGFDSGLDQPLLLLLGEAVEPVRGADERREVEDVSVEYQIFADFVELASVERRERVLGSVDGLRLHRGVDVAEVHAGRDGAEAVKAVGLNLVVGDADFHAGEVLDLVDRLDGERVARAVDPVGDEDLQPLLLKLRALVLVPVGLDELPALLPVVEEERREDDSEIGHAVVRVESSVGEGADGLSDEHGVDQLVLAAELAVGIGGDLHRAAGSLVEQLGPFHDSLAEGFGDGVLESYLEFDHVVGRERRAAEHEGAGESRAAYHSRKFLQ